MEELKKRPRQDEITRSPQLVVGHRQELVHPEKLRVLGRGKYNSIGISNGRSNWRISFCHCLHLSLPLCVLLECLAFFFDASKASLLDLTNDLDP